jgi:hypothetical protein
MTTPSQLLLPFSLPPVWVTVKPSRADVTLRRAMHPRKVHSLLNQHPGGPVLGLQKQGLYARK